MGGKKTFMAHQPHVNPLLSSSARPLTFPFPSSFQLFPFTEQRDRIRKQFEANAGLTDLGVVEKTITDGRRREGRWCPPKAKSFSVFGKNA
jgi:hypothetical protein